MLAGEHFGGRHEGGLMFVGDRREQRVHGDGGLARADVSLQKALHRPFARQITANFLNGSVLIFGELERHQTADMSVDGSVGYQWRRLTAIVCVTPSQGQRQLEDEKLLVDEAPPRSLSGVEATPIACTNVGADINGGANLLAGDYLATLTAGTTRLVPALTSASSAGGSPRARRCARDRRSSPSP